MMVKDYMDNSTHIRFFDDYCSTKENEKEAKNIIISLLLKRISDNRLNDLK